MDVKAGDVVLYAKYAGTDIKMDGVEYKILSVKDAFICQKCFPCLFSTS